MGYIRLNGFRYIIAYIFIVELYVLWFATMAFHDDYSFLILLFNAFVLGIILNDNIPLWRLALKHNWQKYILITYWFYGHKAAIYTYNQICQGGIYTRTSASHNGPDHNRNDHITYSTDALIYVEDILYPDRIFTYSIYNERSALIEP